MTTGLNCLRCSEPLHGRSDKKFCDDGCRSIFNNNLSRSESAYINPINIVLRKNRKILRDSIRSNIRYVLLDTLKVQGFDPNFHTHSWTYNGDEWICIYDYAYRHVSDTHIKMRSVPLKKIGSLTFNSAV